MTEVSFEELGFGVTSIDCILYRPGVAACYLVEQDDEYALIDCGTAKSSQIVLSVLEEKDIRPEQVRYVIPTHVHLDHAGGAGHLMAALPAATLVVHPRGLRHMLDPEKLQAGAIAVYGETEFNAALGALLPVPDDRAIVAEDGLELQLGSRVFKIIHTEGHARHHICIYDELSAGFFTGDTFGLSYPGLLTEQGRFILPTTTPIQFDPDAWFLTLDNLLSYEPKRMYLTHFGMLEDTKRLAADLQESLEDYVDIANTAAASADENRQQQLYQALLEYSITRLTKKGCQLTPAQIEELLTMDITLNSQGLDFWLNKREQ